MQEELRGLKKFQSNILLKNYQAFFNELSNQTYNVALVSHLKNLCKAKIHLLQSLLKMVLMHDPTLLLDVVPTFLYRPHLRTVVML